MIPPPLHMRYVYHPVSPTRKMFPNLKMQGSSMQEDMRDPSRRPLTLRLAKQALVVPIRSRNAGFCRFTSTAEWDIKAQNRTHRL